MLSKAEFERWRKFESTRRLEDWLARKAGGPGRVSRNTLQNYLWAISLFVKFAGFDGPDALLKAYEGRPAELLRLVNEWIADMGRKSTAPASQVAFAAAVKRWLVVNGAASGSEWKRWVVTPRKRFVVEDRIPTKEELRKILMASPRWLQVAILILASNGIRPGALCMLQVRHADLRSDPQLGIIRVPPEASKARVGYFALIIPEARRALEERLEERRRKGRPCGPGSRFVMPPRVERLSYGLLWKAYVRSLKRAGFTEKRLGKARPPLTCTKEVVPHARRGRAD